MGRTGGGRGEQEGRFIRVTIFMWIDRSSKIGNMASGKNLLINANKFSIFWGKYMLNHPQATQNHAQAP